MRAHAPVRERPRGGRGVEGGSTDRQPWAHTRVPSLQHLDSQRIALQQSDRPGDHAGRPALAGRGCLALQLAALQRTVRVRYSASSGSLTGLHAAGVTRRGCRSLGVEPTKRSHVLVLCCWNKGGRGGSLGLLATMRLELQLRRSSLPCPAGPRPFDDPAAHPDEGRPVPITRLRLHMLETTPALLSLPAPGQPLDG